MTTTVTRMFLEIDAGQGNGVKDVSGITSIDGDFLDDQYSSIPFNPVGLARETVCPGKIQAGSTGTINYVPVDAADAVLFLYPDLIAAFENKTLVIVNTRPDRTIAQGLTNPTLGATGFIMANPANFTSNEKLMASFTLALTETRWTNGTTSYTW